MITEPKNAFGPHFPNILHMNINELIKQYIIQGINMNATACFGSVNLISKQNASKARIAYEVAIKKCSDEEKILLSTLKKEKPKPTENHYSKWITEVGELGNALQKKLFADLFQQKKDLAGEEKSKTFKTPGTTVSALSNLMDAIEKLKKEVTKAKKMGNEAL